MLSIPESDIINRMEHEPRHSDGAEKMTAEDRPVSENTAGSVASVAITAAAPKRDRVLPVSILIAAVMITGALVFATLYKGGADNNTNGIAGNVPDSGAAAAAGVKASATTTAAILALGPRDAILGDPNAPVTLIEYGDYQCPFCADYFQKLEPVLKQSYINTGKVRMVFRDLPFLGPESVAAANAAQCAEDQNALWAYHDALYNAKIGDVAKGGSENDGFFTRAVFMSIAARLNLDTAKFADCIDNGTDAGIVAQEKTGAETLIGADSTPTTFVNGALVADSTGEGVGDNQPAIIQAVGAAVAAAK